MNGGEIILNRIKTDCDEAVNPSDQGGFTEPLRA